MSDRTWCQVKDIKICCRLYGFFFSSGCPSNGYVGLGSKSICFDDQAMEYFLIVVAYSAGIAQHGVIT